ncbi:MAG: methionyl-tRNA formyltransferase [Flavobacteriaceae bacterium]|nr:methionyl-tRNA formyltransferase [Flavobacteriaceae bacterium]
MNEHLKIVFMGTPDFAVTILDSLLKAKHTITGVITAPDKPAGRGRKLNQSAVKKYALEQDLNILQPTNLKSEEFIEELSELEANLFIIVAFRMLPKVVWGMPKFGTFNLHASLLPNYRGAAPINWAIINGEKTTGVTTFFIDEKIDTGEIILNKSCSIEEDESAGELHDKLMHLGSKLVLETVALIQEGDVKTKKQEDVEDIKTAYKIHRDTCKINWDNDIDTIYNHIRGLSPYPSAWTTLQNGEEEYELKIFKANKELASHESIPGTLVYNKKTLKIAVSGGYLVIQEVKLQGKRKIAVVDFLNGFNFELDAKVC